MDENYVICAEQTSLAEVTLGVERARFKEAPPPNFMGDCACGDKIPELRVQLGYFRCIKCQTLLEKRGRR